MSLSSSPKQVAVATSGSVRFVIAIGNDLGLSVEEPLRWAEADAQRVHDVMVDLGGVTSSRAVTLLGARARAVEEALLVVRGQITEARRRGDRTELVLSYSGHGDSDRLHLGDDVLPIARLMTLLDATGADATVVILDACRGGALRSGRSRGARAGPGFDVRFVDELAPRGRVVMSSASDGEVAQESDDLEGAFFTHHVLAGLRGAADVDHDGSVALHELFTYAHARTLSGSFGAPAVQHPELTTSLRGQSDLILTRLERSQAMLELAAELGGRFLVADARSGRVLVEVDKPAGASLRLAVPARRLRVLGRQGALTSIAEVDVVRGAATRVGSGDFTQVLRLVGRSRGGDVDVTPFGVFAAWQLSTPMTLPLVPVTAAAPWPAPATGVVVGLERRLFDSPWSVGLQLSGARAGGVVSGGVDVTGVADREFYEWSARAVVPLAIEQWTPVGRLSGGVALGVQGVGQRRERTDGARLAAAGLAPPLVQEGTAIGPLGAVQGSWWIPVHHGVGVVGLVDMGAAVLPIDGEVRPALHVGVAIGIGAEL